MSLDTLYTAETPEGIALFLRPAGVVARGLAFAFDAMIRLGILMVCLILVGVLGHFGGGVLFLVFFAVEWIYPVAFELALRGATPGKRALGLVVVMDSGLPVTPAASITRNLLRAADFLPFAYGFGSISLLLRGDFKRLGDLAAGTLVVYAESVVLHADLPGAAPRAPARPLALQEQAAIVSWAGRAATLTAERLDELAHLARPAFAAGASSSGSISAQSPRGDTIELLGVAQWLVGRREGDAP